MTPIRLLSLLSAGILFVLQSGCSARARIPASTTTMADVYAEAMDLEVAEYTGSIAPGPQAATVNAELDRLRTTFPRLPNPLLTIYVFPHLRGDLPVPGYVTALPLYEQSPFALPHEVALDRHDAVEEQP